MKLFSKKGKGQRGKREKKERKCWKIILYNKSKDIISPTFK
jgi:hypothetical protein